LEKIWQKSELEVTITGGLGGGRRLYEDRNPYSVLKTFRIKTTKKIFSLYEKPENSDLKRTT